MVYKYHFEPIPSEWLSDPVLSRTEPLVLQILANRGFKTAAEVSDFLFPDFSAVIKAVGLKERYGQAGGTAEQSSEWP